MTDRPPTDGARRPRSAGGLVAGIAVIVSLAALAISLYSLVRQSATAAIEIQVAYVIAAGGGSVMAALIAYIRDMSAWDVLEAVFDAIAGLFALVGAVVKGIWNAILSLFGLD